MNSVFLEYPLVFIFVAIIAMIVLINVFAPKRPQGRPGPLRPNGAFPQGLAPRVCGTCGTEHPPHAVYCRRCGARM